ncbi:MAG TPA: hypothetical protein EYP62_01625 [Kiritimatiellae bacterium]|nr:hypothetical protein [Kiritimatiellia bacterium]
MQENLAERTTARRLIFPVTLIVTAFFTLSGQHWGVDADAFMLAQYGRAIAEGRWSSYTPSAEPSTGSTSLLYPFLLALPSKPAAGTPLALWWIGLLDAACFAGIVFGTRRLAHNLGGDGNLAALLTATCGPLLYNCLGGTDMPVFTVLFTWLLVCTSERRPRFAALFALLGALVRPEGILGAAIIGVVLSTAPQARTRIAGLSCVGAALASAIVTFGANRLLTGTWQFHSLLRKGYFASFPFTGAVIRSLHDLAVMARELLFGLNHDRALYFFPVVAGVTALMGILWIALTGTPSHRRIVTAWLLVGTAALMLNASSGWQGHQYDRHLLWLFPGWLILIAAGAKAIHRRLAPTLPRFLPWILVGYQITTLPYFASQRHQQAVTNRAQAQFAARMESVLPTTARVGIINFPHLAFFTRQREFVHLGGYVTPRFSAAGSPLISLEILKHEAGTRFDCWLLTDLERDSPLVGRLRGRPILREDRLAAGPGRLGVYRAVWTPLLAGVQPISPKLRDRLRKLQLTDRMDIGYDFDEAIHRYRAAVGARNAVRLPLKVVGPVGRSSSQVIEIGRLIDRSESFDVFCVTGRAVVAVVRTCARAVLSSRTARGKLRSQEIRFSGPLRLKIHVGSRSPIAVNIPLQQKGSLSEAMFTIPAEAVESSPVRLRIEGRYISLAWWFYQ